MLPKEWFLDLPSPEKHTVEDNTKACQKQKHHHILLRPLGRMGKQCDILLAYLSIANASSHNSHSIASALT